MINIYKLNKNKLEENKILNDISFKILNSKKEKLYSKKIISELNYIIENKDIEEVILFLLKNNISLKDSISINYRKTMISFKNNLLNKEILEYKHFKIELQRLILNNKCFIIDLLNSFYKNSSRKKGNLFRSIIMYLKKNNFFEKDNLFNNLTIFERLEEIEINQNFIFIPQKDEDIILALKKLKLIDKNKSYKGRDILIHYNGVYYVGEAKEIDEVGGSQTNQFKDIETCLKEYNNDKIKGFGIIYGMCLLTNNIYQNAIDHTDNIIPLSELIFNLKNTLEKLT